MELARITGYPEGIILKDLNDISTYTELGNHFLLYSEETGDLSGGDMENGEYFSEEWQLKDPQVKWNLTITTDPYPTLSLTPREAMALLWLFTEFSPPELLKTLKDKLMHQLLPGEEIAVAEEMAEKLYTHGGVAFSETKYLYKLREAVLGDKKVRAKYYAKNIDEEVDWLLWPLGLVFHTGNGTWYLVAKKDDSEEIVVCHLGRVLGVKVLTEEFVYPEDFRLRQYLRLRWGMDMSNAEKVKVRFYNEANVLEKVKREFKTRGLAELVQLEDGSLEYSGEIHGINNFAKWVLSFGSSAVVLEPQWLRDKMIEIARGWCSLSCGLNTRLYKLE